jgi:hypothetical protein
MKLYLLDPWGCSLALQRTVDNEAEEAMFSSLTRLCGMLTGRILVDFKYRYLRWKKESMLEPLSTFNRKSSRNQQAIALNRQHDRTVVDDRCRPFEVVGLKRQVRR